MSSMRLSMGSTVVLTINYPESELNMSYVEKYDVVFNLNLYSCMENHLAADGQSYTYGSSSCPGGEWFAGDSNSANYVVRPVDRVGPNEFRKTFDLGSEYTGIFFVTINNDFRSDASGVLNSLPVCNTVPDMQSFCTQNGSPYVGLIKSVTDTIELNTYPWFGMKNPGETYAILPNYASTFWGSTIASRDINAYVPASVSQNSVRRKVNIMVVNDGSIDEVSSYVFNGFELGQQTGVVPESLMVGIPQNPDDYCNRQYELSYSPCLVGWSKYNRYTDPPTTSNFYGCPGNSGCPLGGGNDNYLTWIYQVVIPAVLDELGMDLGEVSIVGGSMGGLTACYAPSKFPHWYSRGFCYAPAVMWNYGELAQLVKNNFMETNALPKAVVMMVGHEAYDIFRNDTTGDTRNMLQIQRDVFDAYLAIGMDPMDFRQVSLSPAGDNTQTVNILGGAPMHMAMFYDQRGAFHAPSNWMVSFFTHLQVLYRPSFNDSTRRQRTDYDWYVGQPAPYLPTICLDLYDDTDRKLFALSF